MQLRQHNLSFLNCQSLQDGHLKQYKNFMKELEAWFPLGAVSKAKYFQETRNNALVAYWVWHCLCHWKQSQIWSQRLWAQPTAVLSPLVPLFHQYPNRISEQTDFLMRSLTLGSGCKGFQAAEWLSGMQVPQPMWVCGLCLHCFSPWGQHLCDEVCS